MKKSIKKLVMSSHKAVILAGGKGTRLYPITLEMPKPLIPVGKKPMINHIVDSLYSYGVREIAVLVSKEFKDDFDWWIKRYYSFKNSPVITILKENKPLGTFGGLYFLKKWIGKNHFFMINADNLSDINLNRMSLFHTKNNSLATIALTSVENPQDYGVVVCNSADIKEFIEKPKNPVSNYVNSGWYLISPEIFDYHPGPKFLMIEKDIFPKLVKTGRLTGFKFKEKWIDCGTWERYQKAQKMF
jgi:NDP-sugar pyrophosphorylase family protein